MLPRRSIFCTDSLFSYRRAILGGRYRNRKLASELSSKIPLALSESLIEDSLRTKTINSPRIRSKFSLANLINLAISFLRCSTFSLLSLSINFSTTFSDRFTLYRRLNEYRTSSRMTLSIENKPLLYLSILRFPAM